VTTGWRLRRRRARVLYICIACQLGILAMAPPAFADESPFGYLYTAETSPKGEWEYEQWNTVRTGKAQGSYTAFDLRNEIEYGVTDAFSASFYLNSSYLSTKGVPDPDDASQNLPDQSSFDVNGVSTELKYRLLSPYKDPVGLVVYMEPELGVRNRLSGADTIERALEFKLITQKNFFDDRLVLAANATFEPEWERHDGERSKELKNEYSFGAAYQVAPKWTAGVECLNRRKFDDQDFGRQATSAYFLGPSVHYAEKSWWTTLTVLPQITGTPRSDSFRTLGEYEQMEIRLRFGIDFSWEVRA
jgi:hypothetical protein